MAKNKYSFVVVTEFDKMLCSFSSIDAAFAFYDEFERKHHILCKVVCLKLD